MRLGQVVELLDRRTQADAGELAAAGAGERFGGPKALAREDDGTSWLLRSVQALRPCAEIVVVLAAPSVPM